MQLGNKVAVELAPYGITVNNIAPAAPMDASLEDAALGDTAGTKEHLLYRRGYDPAVREPADRSWTRKH